MDKQGVKSYNKGYVRISKKACMRDIGMKKFKFDYDKAFLEYKYFAGERMSRKEWKKMGKFEKCNSYCEWEELVICENRQKTEEELHEFDHYLDNCISMINPQENLYTILCSVVFTAIITFFCDHINDFDNLVIKNHWVISLMLSIIFFSIVIVIMGVIMFNVMLSLWSTDAELTFLKGYRNIIRRMLEK